MGKLRNEDPEGALYHVWARGNNRQMLFVDPTDRHVYLRLLAEVVEKDGWLCLAYCLMGNHVHLVIETQGRDLARGMQRLHARYARWFNRRHTRTGHLFERPYGSKVIEDEGHLYTTARYVALNPVDAGLCAAPEDWEWGSSAATLSENPPKWLAIERLFAILSSLGGAGRKRYAELISHPPLTSR